MHSGSAGQLKRKLRPAANRLRMGVDVRPRNRAEVADGRFDSNALLKLRECSLRGSTEILGFKSQGSSIAGDRDDRESVGVQIVLKRLDLRLSDTKGEILGEDETSARGSVPRGSGIVTSSCAACEA